MHTQKACPHLPSLALTCPGGQCQGAGHLRLRAVQVSARGAKPKGSQTRCGRHCSFCLTTRSA